MKSQDVLCETKVTHHVTAGVTYRVLMHHYHAGIIRSDKMIDSLSPTYVFLLIDVLLFDFSDWMDLRETIVVL